MFADDTSVFLEGETIIETINIFNSELQKLIQGINLWLAANKLKIHLSKTHFMIFHRARMKLNNGPIISHTLKTKYRKEWVY